MLASDISPMVSEGKKANQRTLMSLIHHSDALDAHMEVAQQGALAMETEAVEDRDVAQAAVHSASPQTF